MKFTGLDSLVIMIMKIIQFETSYDDWVPFFLTNLITTVDKEMKAMCNRRVLMCFKEMMI